jgi:AcrR family transcriptional regulator
VLDAAERVMSEHGYEAATLARIVDLSGVPMSSVYHYFGSKDGVLLAVMERGAQRFFAELPQITPRAGSLEEHLAGLIAVVRGALDDQPHFLRLLVVMTAQPPKGAGEEVNGVITRIRDEAVRRIRGQIAIAFDIDPASATAERLARFSLAAIDGAFLAGQADEERTIDGVLDHLPTALAAMHGAMAA